MKNRNKKADLFLHISILLILISSCNQPIDKTNQSQVATDTNKVKIEKAETRQTENIAIFSHKINLQEILQYEHTSGRSNKPDLISDYDTTKKLYYGFYCIIDGKSTLRPPVIADIFVSFEKLPWYGDDTDQEILVLIVRDKLFKYNPFSFAVGDKIEKIDTSLIKLITIDDIHYYTGGGCTVAIKLQDNLISEYLIWI